MAVKRVHQFGRRRRIGGEINRYSANRGKNEGVESRRNGIGMLGCRNVISNGGVIKMGSIPFYGPISPLAVSRGDVSLTTTRALVFT